MFCPEQQSAGFRIGNQIVFRHHEGNGILFSRSGFKKSDNLRLYGLVRESLFIAVTLAQLQGHLITKLQFILFRKRLVHQQLAFITRLNMTSLHQLNSFILKHRIQC